MAKVCPDSLERRRHPRFDFRIPLRYKKIGPSFYEFRGSLMRDISEGGTRMTIYEFLPLDLKLAIEIPLASGTRPVQGTGRVAWVRKTSFAEQYDVGVEFVSLNQEDQTRIAEFLANE